MNTHKKTVRDVEVRGKKVLLRCDFNVPQDKETGAITSDKRIVAALPTIQYLLENGAAVIACSHLGKPKNGPDPKLSLAPHKGQGRQQRAVYQILQIQPGRPAVQINHAIRLPPHQQPSDHQEIDCCANS